jgi:acyl-CoA thioester hydrolase
LIQPVPKSGAPSEPQVEPFSWAVRVYYEDTDAAGVVYYANYLRFMERARTEWLRSLGYDQSELAARHGIVFMVRSAAIDYRTPARFNDTLDVSVELDKVGAGHIDVIQRVTRNGEVLARATVKIACVGLRTMRPVRIPQPLATKIRT